MSDYIEGGLRYENIRSNAYWHNVHLDTSFRPDADARETAIKHFEDCKSKPTVALLASKKSETNHYPDFKKRNERILMQNPKVKETRDSFEKTFNKNYPKTGKARKYLIDKESIVLNYVKPRAKTLGRMLFKIFGR